MWLVTGSFRLLKETTSWLRSIMRLCPYKSALLLLMMLPISGALSQPTEYRAQPGAAVVHNFGVPESLVHTYGVPGSLVHNFGVPGSLSHNFGVPGSLSHT